MSIKFVFKGLLLVMLSRVGLPAYSAVVPYWRSGVEPEFKEDPAETARNWFRSAGQGMFVHLNLASLCERGRDDYFLWARGTAPDRLLEFVGVSRADYEAASDKD